MSRYLQGREVHGLDLRYLLTITIADAGQACRVSELAERLGRDGFEIRGRPSKTISDALRWEVRRGRVWRPSRGLYAAGTMPRQTRSRIRHRVRSLRQAVAAYADWGDAA